MALAQGSPYGERENRVKPRERKGIFTWEERKRMERARYCRLQEDSQEGDNKGLLPSRR